MRHPDRLNMQIVAKPSIAMRRQTAALPRRLRIAPPAMFARAMVPLSIDR